MKTRLTSAPLALVLAATAAAGQQPQVDATVHYSLNWTNSATGAQDPIGPGQSAVLMMTATMIPAPGASVAVNNISGWSGTQMTLRGLQQMFLDLVGTNDATGTWSGLLIDPAWDLIGPGGYGTPVLGGTRLLNIQAGQFPFSQSSVMTTNPIANIWIGTWTPLSYEQRTVNFATINGDANPEPFASRVIVSPGPGVGVPPYVGSVHNGFSSTNIPVIPAPSSLAVLGVAALAARRQRPHSESIW